MEEWSYVRNVLWGPAAPSPLIMRAICFGGALYVGCMCPSAVARPTPVSMLIGVAGPWSNWLSDLALCGDCLLLVGGAGSWH